MGMACICSKNYINGFGELKQEPSLRQTSILFGLGLACQAKA